MRYGARRRELAKAVFTIYRLALKKNLAARGHKCAAENLIHEMGHAFCLWGTPDKWPVPGMEAGGSGYMSDRISWAISEQTDERSDEDELSILAATYVVFDPLGLKEATHHHMCKAWEDQGGNRSAVSAALVKPLTRKVATFFSELAAGRYS